MKKFICAVAVFALAGCITINDKEKIHHAAVTVIEIGMGVAELVEIMGEPESVVTVATRDLDGDPVRRWEFSNSIVFTQGGVVIAE